MKIFGREPAVIVGLVEGILAAVVTLSIGLDAEHAALIVAVVTALGGVLTGWATTDTRLGVVTGLTKALLALVVGFGLHIADSTQGALLALIPLVFMFVQRAGTSPAAVGSFGEPKSVETEALAA